MEKFGIEPTTFLQWGANDCTVMSYKSVTSQTWHFVALSLFVAFAVLRLVHAAVPGRADQDAAHSVPTGRWIRQRYGGGDCVLQERYEPGSPSPSPPPHPHLPRVPLSLGVQQPDAARVSRQPGDVLLRQQSIAGLHLQPATNFCQPRAGWWQEEGRVRPLPLPLSSCRRHRRRSARLVPADELLVKRRALRLWPRAASLLAILFCGAAAVTWNLNSLVSPLLRVLVASSCQNTRSVSLTLTVKPKFFSLRNLRFVQCCLL